MSGKVVSDRKLAIRLLASGLYDLFPLPETSTGAMLRRGTLRGEAPSEKIPCPDCGNTETPGWRSDRFKRLTPCLTCGGTSDDVRSRMVAGKGYVKVDPYTRRIVGSETTPAPARVESWLCNVCHGKGVEPKRPSERCRACHGEGQREHRPFILNITDPTAGDPETVLEAAIVRRDEAGSFHELEEALAYMRRKSPHRHRVFWQVAVVKTLREDDLTEHQARWLEAADEQLAGLMPAEIRVPGYLLAQHRNRKRVEQSPLRVKGLGVSRSQLAARDADIARRYREGESTSAIAAEFDLSERSVQAILNRALVA